MSPPAADSNAKLEALPVAGVSPATPKSSLKSSPQESGKKTAESSGKTSSGAAHRSREGTFWLNGEVLACACPACGAPMTIRLWLMMADCWRCGVSLELTEEQEREALELMAVVESQTPEPKPAEPTAQTKTDQAATTPQARKPEQKPTEQPEIKPTPTASAPTKRPQTQQQTQVKAPASPSDANKPRRSSIAPVAPPPIAAPAPQQQPRSAPAAPPVQSPYLQPEPETRPSGFWRDFPAWLISMIVHLVLLLLLGMWTYGKEEPRPELVLTVEIGPQHREGGLVETEEEKNETEFDLPIDKEPTNEQEKEALVRADEDAKELRLDDKNSSSLPSLTRVRADLVSEDPYKRMHAARDPRVRTEVVRQEGGTTLTEAAVARGLRWISHHQSEDGSWSLHQFSHTPDCNKQCNGHAGTQSETSGTSMALMAMLGAGQTHRTGIYKEQVSHGLQWLVSHQKENGDLRAGSSGNSGMYAHGQAAIVLCDAFKLTGDEALRAPAQRAIDFICEAQHEKGGWRYSPGQAGDLSVVGWQLMAMHSAKSAYLNVPNDNQKLANRFLNQVQTDKVGGLYSYTPRSGPTPTMTAEGLLSRMYLGWNGQNPGLKSGVNFLIEKHLPNSRKRNMYYWYYGTQVMHHWGGEPWEKWNVAMREMLVESQETSGHAAGSWSPAGFPHGGAGGRLYVTSLATCTLEVYYRYAPLYRRIKLD